MKDAELSSVLLLPSNNDQRETPSSKWTRRQWVVLVLLFVGCLGSQACMSILAAFFPDEATSKGATQTEVGLIFSVFEIVIAFTAPVFGHFLVQLGVKFSFVSGLTCLGTVSVLYGFLHYCPNGRIYVLMCFVCRIVDALFASLFLTAAYAVAAIEFSSDISLVAGSLELAQGLGFTIGPPIGGFLFKAWNFLLPFLVLGSFLFCIGVISYFTLPPMQGSGDDKASMRQLLSLPQIWVVSATILGIGSLITVFEPTFEKRLDDFNLDAPHIGLVFLLLSGTYALTAPAWGKLASRPGASKPMLLIGLLFSAAACVFIGPAPFLAVLNIRYKMWVLLVSVAVLGIASSVGLVPTYELLVEGALEGGMGDNMATYGLISGLFQFSYSMGGFVGPTYGGAIQEALGFGWVMAVTAAFLALIAMVVFVFLLCRAAGKCRPRVPHVTSGEEDERSPLLGNGVVT